MVLKRKVKGLLTRIFKKMFNAFGKLPRNSKVVIFESFHGKQYSCNPRAIYEYMLEHHPEYKLYWSMNKKESIKFKNEKLNILPRFTLKWVFYMATAKYWVINTRLPRWMKKPQHTIYLQTWHGTPLKKLGVDIPDVKMPGTTTEKYRKNFIKESSNWDYLIAPNNYSAEIFKKAFVFENKMLLSGYPRNDYLYNKNSKAEIEAIKRKIDLPVNKKVILYAPTWRDDEYIEVGKYKFSLKMDLDAMRDKLGDEYVILLRMHYLIAEHLNIEDYHGFAYNFSDYHDIRELYLISDVLVTDYSSVFFDYANLQRPVIFYTYDIEKYRDSLRGFYLDFDSSVPGPIVKTTSELISAIENTDNPGGNYTEKMNTFYDEFCSWEDGNASKRIVEEVFQN